MACAHALLLFYYDFLKYWLNKQNMECVGVSSANKTRERSVFPVGCDSADEYLITKQREMNNIIYIKYDF